MDRLSIESLTVLGMPPVDFVHLAADLGCHQISMAPTPLLDTGLYPQWSLRDDAPLRRELAAALRDRGVSISTGEGFIVLPGTELRDQAGDLEILCELGTPRVNVCGLEADEARCFDQYATLVDMAEAAGVETTLEFGPIFGSAGDLDTALAALRHVGKPSFRLLVDSLHLHRAGLAPKDIAALDPELIGYAQLCDAPQSFTRESYLHEASYERMAPGAGELPLAELVAALPSHVVLGLEIPMLADAKAGVSPEERVGGCLKAARELLARV